MSTFRKNAKQTNNCCCNDVNKERSSSNENNLA